MEELFMQAFERRDWVAAQMRQQVGSYDQSLACAILAAGKRPPQCLLPSRPGGTQEPNGRPVLSDFVFPGSHITTPAINRTIYQPPAVPSSSFSVGIPCGYTHLETTSASLDTSQHQKVQEKETSINKEFAKTSAEANMFSLIQRSRSRKRNIEDHLREKDQAAHGGSSDGLQDRMERSKLANVGLNRTTTLSSSEPCGGGLNDDGTKTPFPGQENNLYANKRNSTEVLKCSKVGALGHEGVHLDCSPSLVLENQTVSSDNNAMVPSDCSARDLPRVHAASNLCHPLPEAHLFVEPKILQFESVCINASSEKMSQSLECASESAHLDLSETHALNEDRFSTGCYRVPHSMGSLSIDGVEPGFLNPDSTTVKQHPQCGSLDITSMHCQNEDLSQIISSEVPNSRRKPLLEKGSYCIPETNSLEGHCSKVSELLEKETMIGLESNCSERLCSDVNPPLETDTLHSVENAESVRKLNSVSFSAKAITQNSKPLEQQRSDSYVLPPPHSGSVQLSSQLADISSRPPPSGILLDSFLVEDGCEHLSHSVINDTSSQCSPYRPAASPDLLQPHIVNSGGLYQLSHSCHKSQRNNTYSSGCAVEDASIPTEKELYQDQHSFDTSPLELNNNFADDDTSFGHTLHTHNEMPEGNRAADLVNCHSEKPSDAQKKSRDLTEAEAYGFSCRTRKNETMVQKSASRISIGAMNTAERSREISTMNCTESPQQDGKKQETTLFDNAVQTDANPCTTENNKGIKSSRPSVRYSLRSLMSHKKINLLQSEGRSAANDQKRSAADGVEENGISSSKRRRINCQSHTVLSSSPHRNSLSLSHQVDIGGPMLTTANFSGKSQPSGRYFLRSSESSECMSLKSERRNAASLCNISMTSLGDKNRNSSPRRRNAAGLDNENGNSQGQFQNILHVASTVAALPSCCDTLVDNDETCTEEENLCLEGQKSNDTNLSVPHQQMTLQMDNVTSQNLILESENNSRLNSITMSPSCALDQHGEQTYAPDALVDENFSYGSSAELDGRCKSNGSKQCLFPGVAITRQEGDESVECDDTMPEFERFDVPVQFDSPSVGTRAFEALCESRKLVTLGSHFSKKYNTNRASGAHQLWSTMSEKLTKFSFPDDLQQYTANNDRSITDIFGACGLGFDDSFSISDVAASCPSNASNRQENNDIPLTPSVEKYSMGKLSGRSGSSSEMGSIPELACFRIDENSSIAEENEFQGRLPGSVGMNYLHQLSSGRKALQDITELCQNNGSIGLAAERCSSEINHHTNLIHDHGSDKPKDNPPTSAKREGKVSHSLHARLSRTELHCGNGRHRSEANVDKQSKPSNIVANVTSFIPLVKPNLQPTTVCVKKDVRVKALEAAEAAKRLEEKRHNEREMRKAAAKLERERLKQEKELKQKKEEEQKKKRDADMAARKRHRGEEERREKERKRKCTEEARKQQKQFTEKRHAVNDEKDIRQKASDNKELRNNLIDAVKVQVKSDEKTTEPALAHQATKSNNEKSAAVNESPASFGSHAVTNIPNSLEESYTMTPYKDSDEEDDDDFEHEEESKRRRKFIPSWARKENLDKFLLSNPTLDPREIFSQKCSFNLSDVLSAHIPRRGIR